MAGKLPTQTYQDIFPDKIDFEYLRNRLKIKKLQAKEALFRKHPHADKFFKEKGIDLGKIREHSAKLIGAGALTGTLLLSLPVSIASLPAPLELIESIKNQGVQKGNLSQQILVESLQKALPERVQPISREEEKYLEQLFANTIGVPARASLEGEHLNTTYGLIGAEQHLARFPGDSMANHPKIPQNDEGMAPGLGAWGYFAFSRGGLTPALVETEKWYAVAQTLYLPDWSRRQPYLANWYKYRKVLIVNTQNGNAAVAAIADSGPAAWTGKSFGGSPEVMDYLGGPNYKKGPVVFFFVDDPTNKIPLGPVEYNNINVPKVKLTNI